MYKAIINEDTYISIFEPRHAEALYHLIDGSRDSIGSGSHSPQKQTILKTQDYS